MFKRVILLILCGLWLVFIPLRAQEDVQWTAWLYSGGRAMLLDSQGKVQKTVTLPLPQGDWGVESSRIAVSHSARFIAYVAQPSSGFEQRLRVLDTESSRVMAAFDLPQPENGPLNNHDRLSLTPSEDIFNEDDTALAFSYFLEGERWQIVVLDLQTSKVIYTLDSDDAISPFHLGDVPLVQRYGQGGVDFTRTLIQRDHMMSHGYQWDPVAYTVRREVAYANTYSDTFYPSGDVVMFFSDERFPRNYPQPLAHPQRNALHVYVSLADSRYPFYENANVDFFDIHFVQGRERVLAGAWDAEAKATWLLLERDGSIVRRFQDAERKNVSGTPDGFIYLTTAENKLALVEVNTRDFDPGRTVWVGEGDWQIIGVKQNLPETLSLGEWVQLAEPLTVALFEATDEPTAPTPLPSPLPLLRPGVEVRVQTKKDEYLNLRSGPGTNYEVLLLLKDETRLTLLEGPQEADGFVWWKVRTTTGIEGWVVETVGGLHSLIP